MAEDQIYLEPILKNFFSDEMSQLNFCLPARIENIQNLKEGRVDVKPLFTPRFLDGTYCEIPVIRNVLLMMPCSAKSGSVFGVEQGDTVTLIFAQCNLDSFKAGAIEPYSTVFDRFLDINDAIAYIGAKPFNKSVLNKDKHVKDYSLGDTSLFNNLGTEKENKINLKKDGTNSYIAKEHKMEGNIVTEDDIIIGGVSLKQFIQTHTHPYVNVNTPSTTSPPNPL